MSSEPDWVCAQCGASGQAHEYCECDKCETEGCEQKAEISYSAVVDLVEQPKKRLCWSCFHRALEVPLK
jgi:hypothetical protein